MVRLGRISETIMGQAPASKECNTENKGTPFVKVGQFGETYSIVNEWTTKPLKVVTKGDVLICVVGATIGKLNLAIDCAIGRSVAGIRPNTEILHTYYLFTYLKQWTQRLRTESQGSAIGVITKPMLHDLLVPLPPLSTQHQIVEILEEADSLRKLRQQADEKMKDLIPSLFVKMFGEPATNPKGWKMEKIGDVCNKNTGTRNPSDIANGYFEYVDISSIDNICGTITTARTIPNIEAPSRARKVIKTNDVLISTVRPNLNAVAIVPSLLNDQICSTGFCVLRITPDMTNHHYIYAIARSNHFVETMTKKTQGASYPAVSDKDMFDFTIPLPPLPLQQEFAKLVEDIEAEKARQAESRKKLDELFQSLMQRAFTGELAA